MCRSIADLSEGKDIRVFAHRASGFTSVTADMELAGQLKCRSLRYAAG